MTVNILYFAALRDTLGRANESIALPPGVSTVGELQAFLADRGDAWSALASQRNVRAAVNHRMVSAGDSVTPGDEVAFFPPVTGG